jgi:hypothetical protein
MKIKNKERKSFQIRFKFDFSSLLVQLEPLVLPAVSSLQKTFLASTD